MFLRNILLMLLVTAATLNAQLIEAWSGEVTNGNDKRIFTLEISRFENTYKINWSLSEANIYRMPVGEFSYNPNDSLSAALLIFNHPMGKIEGKFINNTFSGNFVWNKSSSKISLEKVSGYEIPFYEKEYKINNKEVVLAGTLITPNGKGSFPAVVFLHGSGPGERWWSKFYAKEFAKIGVASFIFDKRGSGESTGNWITSSLDDLTSDASAVINFLKTIKEINPDRIGVSAVSQSGWVTSRLAVSETRPAFAIVNSGGGSTPYEVEMVYYKKNISHSSLTDNEKEDALSLVKDYLEYLKTGNNREILVGKINAAKTKNWYKAINVGRVLPSHENRKNWEWVPTYNPINDIVKINFPIIILMGEKDDLIPVENAVNNWREGLTEAQNKYYEIKIFESAGHALRLGGHGNFGSFPRYAEGSLEYQIEWLKKNILK